MLNTINMLINMQYGKYTQLTIPIGQAKQVNTTSLSSTSQELSEYREHTLDNPK